MRRYEVVLIDQNDDGTWCVGDGGMSFADNLEFVEIKGTYKDGTTVLIQSSDKDSMFYVVDDVKITSDGNLQQARP